MEVVRVQALRSGQIVMDGVPTTLATMVAKLAQIKADKGGVLYYREQPDQEPTPEQWEIFKAVADARVPIQMFVTPDFSDAGGPGAEPPSAGPSR